MKNIFIAIILGLVTLAAMPIQSKATAIKQHEVVLNQGVANCELHAVPGSAIALVNLPANQFCDASVVSTTPLETAIAANQAEVINDSAGKAPDTPTNGDTFSLGSFLLANGAEILLAFLAFMKVIVRLTPWVKDDEVFGKVDRLISWFVPNYGGKG